MSVYLHGRRAIAVALIGAFSILGGLSLRAQETGPASEIRNGAERPSIAIERIGAGEGPEIDGVLTDAVWQRASVIEDFRQVFPTQGATPTERTQVFLLYDDTTLYVGVHAHDENPGAIAATVMNRDGNIGQDDFISVLIDSYNTGRDAFGFEINPAGARREGLVENNDSFKSEWNTIWRGRAQITETGWVAELAIPFQSISFDPAAESWGLQVVRRIARRNEEMRWAGINQSFGRIDMTLAGRLSGITDASQGLGLDIEALSTVQWIRNWEQPGREDDIRLIPSGNVFYKFTPSLTGTLTINTDFSDTPLDSRQVNTGRFSLFFPETRDFFLQDAALFEFGGRPFNNVNGLPFFSRRIGIVDGETVGLTAGAKFSGSAGPFTIGALSTRVSGGDDLDPQILSVLRASARVLGDSRIGIIATNGDPTGTSDNTVVGADFQFLDSTVFGDQRLVADAFFLASRSDRPEEQGNAYGLEISYPNDRIRTFYRFKHLDADYNPALGFVNRTGIRTHDSDLRYRWRPEDSYLRFFDVGTWFDMVTDLDNTVQDRTNGIWFGGGNHIGDELFLNFWNSVEVIPEPFFLPNDVLVPAARYEWNRGNFWFSSSSARPVRFEIEYVCCSFYDGTRHFLDMELALRPSRYFNIEFNHLIDKFILPTGSVTIQVSSVDLNINISPDIQFTSQMQYDNISQGFSFLGRLFWEIRPETELFLSVSNAAITNIRDYRTLQSGASIRVGNTFRF